jgi:hypothetical protein
LQHEFLLSPAASVFFQMRIRVVAGDSLMNLLRSTSY